MKPFKFLTNNPTQPIVFNLNVMDNGSFRNLQRR